MRVKIPRRLTGVILSEARIPQRYKALRWDTPSLSISLVDVAALGAWLMEETQLPPGLAVSVKRRV